MSFEARLKKAGIKLPEPPKASGSYSLWARYGDLVFVSGQTPKEGGKRVYIGRVGQEFSVDEGYKAARLSALNCLSVLREAIGSLDKVKQVVKATGFVRSAPGFDRQPAVIDGASDLLLEVFGEAGKHARCAVGVAELPFGAAVEVEMAVAVSD